jgi:HD-GYP domain-containing protein (c-di-GMP phosphodiesterase class II)
VHGPRAQGFLDGGGPGPGEAPIVSFCSVPLKVQDRVIGLLCAHSYTPGRVFTEGQRKLLAVLASRTAVSIEHAQLYADLVTRNAELAQANRSLEDNFKATLIGFAHALEEADRYTRGHSERVSFYAQLVAVGLDLREAETARIIQAGLMHDIGKIGIKYERLNKPGKLTAEEMAMFRTHPSKGKRILETMPFMNDLVPGAWCHHERWDGTGYPRGLAGDAIPLVGRIVSIADTYDAMTSDRAYRKALPHEVAVRELERCAGSQFDPELVRVFIRRITDYRLASPGTPGRPLPA